MNGRDCRLVMVVEDDESIRMSMGEALREAGYRVIEAAHGLEALEYLKGGGPAPCMILLDLMMPVMSGYELLDTLEVTGLMREVTVKVLTAVPGRVRGIGTIHKPFKLDDLLDLLRANCDLDDDKEADDDFIDEPVTPPAVLIDGAVDTIVVDVDAYLKK